MTSLLVPWHLVNNNENGIGQSKASESWKFVLVKVNVEHNTIIKRNTVKWRRMLLTKDDKICNEKTFQRFHNLLFFYCYLF